MTPVELREAIIRLDDVAGRARLAVHALEDAPEGIERVAAAKALRGLVRNASTTAHAIDVELRATALVS